MSGKKRDLLGTITLFPAVDESLQCSTPRKDHLYDLFPIHVLDLSGGQIPDLYGP